MSFGLSAAAWGAIGTIGGGLLGSKGGGSTQTTKSEPPAWMLPYLQGGNGAQGIVPAAYDVFNRQNAQGGMNPLMRAGMEGQRQFLTSPEYSRGFNTMMNQGNAMMDQPIAQNPFSVGYSGMFPGGLTPRTGMMSKGLGLSGPLFKPSQANAPGFSYANNPTLQGALNPIGAAPPTPQPQPNAQPAVDPYTQLLNELMQQWLANPGGNGGDGSDGGAAAAAATAAGIGTNGGGGSAM